MTTSGVSHDRAPAWRSSETRSSVIATLTDDRFLALLMVLLAAADRLVAIASRLHVDDAYTWLVASSPNPSAFLHNVAAFENTPPLSYLILTPLPIDHPAWLRAPAVAAGVLLSVVIYFGLRNQLGPRVALLAATAVAVSPYLITYSDLARGFMLADLAMLTTMVLILRLADGAPAFYWGLVVLTGALALYTEYSAVIFLLALAIATVIVRALPARRVFVATALMFATLLPWIPQMVRAQNQVGITKFAPAYAAPSVTGLRDAVVSLALGEGGGTGSGFGRWLEVALAVAVAAACAAVIHHRWSSLTPRARRTTRVLAITTGLTLVGHALAAAVGVHIFTQRYMTILIPLAAILGATAVVATGSTRVLAITSAALVGLGIAAIVRRYDHEWEQGFTPVRHAVAAMHPRTILTDTPVVVYYLRDLRPRFDRPSNLGAGDAGSCQRPCLVIDDTRIYTGTPRQVSGVTKVIGPYLLTLER